jgi:hypothetical protein
MLVLNILTNCAKIIFSFQLIICCLHALMCKLNLYEISNNVEFEFALKFNPLMVELNHPSQSCLPRFLFEILILKRLTALLLYKLFGVNGLAIPVC